MSGVEASARRPRRTQAERRQEAESRLLEAGLKLVAKKGIAGTTLAEVGEAAGFSRGIVAHHFGSKAAFVQALVESIQRRFYEGQRSLAPAPAGGERLLASAKMYLTRTGDMSAAMNAMVTEAIIYGGELQQALRAFTSVAAGYYGALVEQAVNNREVSAEVDAEAMGFVLLSMLRGMAATELLLGDDPRLKRVRAAALLAIERILGYDRKGGAAVPARKAVRVKPSTS
ncbi:MAG: TetR/AcrR family transcriptional regulator [Rubrivivax sp.]